MKEDEGDDKKISEEKIQDIKLWGIFLFGLIGATATSFTVSSLFYFSYFSFFSSSCHWIYLKYCEEMRVTMKLSMHAIIELFVAVQVESQFFSISFSRRSLEEVQ
jgi:hypothetical protein